MLNPILNLDIRRLNQEAQIIIPGMVVMGIGAVQVGLGLAITVAPYAAGGVIMAYGVMNLHKAAVDVYDAYNDYCENNESIFCAGASSNHCLDSDSGVL